MSQIITLENEEMKVQIKSLGGELVSVQDLKTQKEYMWCADAKYWSRCSPVLFPFVGNTRNKEYITKGKTYTMTQHGFARDMEFEVLKPHKADEVWFEIESNQETLQNYPYEFKLALGYRLKGRELTVLWKVTNPSWETMYFSIGGHPGFNCPIEEEEKQSDYKIKFGSADQIVCTRINDTGLATDEKVTYTLEEGRLPVTEHLFDHDALVVEDNQIKEVSLCRPDNSPYLTVSFDAPLFGVWSMPGKKAPYICIEPWYGRCDHEAFTGTLEERAWGNTLEGQKVWEASYVIHIC